MKQSGPSTWSPVSVPSPPTEEEVELAGVIGLSLNRHAIDVSIADFGVDSHIKEMCVLAGAVGSRAFPVFDLPAKPTSVEFWALSRERNSDPNMGNYLFPTGECRITQNAWTHSGDWSGHLVLDVKGMLVDPTAGQVAKPSEGLLVPEVVIVPPSARPADNIKDYAEFWCEDGETVLRYRQEPKNTGYRQFEYWTDQALIGRLVESVVADVQREWVSRGHEPLVLPSPRRPSPADSRRTTWPRARSRTAR